MPCIIDYVNPRNDGSGPGCPEFCVEWPLTFDNITGVVVADDWSPFTQGFGLFLIIFTSTVVPISTLVFIVTMYRTYLERRGIWLILLSSFGIFMPVIAVEVREFVGRQNNSCMLFLFTQIFSFVFFLSTYGTRTFLLYNKYAYKTTQAQFWQHIAWVKNGAALPEGMENSVVGNGIRGGMQRRTRGRGRIVSQKEVERAKYLCSERFGLQLNAALLVIALLFLLIHTLARPEKYGNHCLGCEDDLSEILFLAFLDFSICAMSLYALYLVKDESDPLQIITELKWAFIWNVAIAQPAFLLHLTDPGDLVKTGVWEWGHFIIVGFLMMFLTSVPYQVYKAFKIDVQFKFEKSDTRLLDVLLNDDARLCFSTYLLSEFSSENCYFWKAASDWREEYKQKNAGQRVEEAQELYDMFIRHGSPMEVNISGTTHDNLAAIFEDSIVVTDNDVPVATFERSVNEVYRLMEDDTFGRFLNSELFASYRAVEGNEATFGGERAKKLNQTAQKANEWVNTTVTKLTDNAVDAVKAISERAKKKEVITTLNMKPLYDNIEGESDEETAQ